MNAHNIGIYRAKWSAPLAGLLLLTIAFHSEDAISAEKIHLIVPWSDMEYMRSVLHPFAAQLYSEEGIELRWKPVTANAASLIEETTTAQQSGEGPILWFGWSEKFAANLYAGSHGNLQPDWVLHRRDFQGLGDVPAGMVALGAGWYRGEPDRPVILSLPRRMATIPIVSMAVIRDWHSGYGREGDEIIQAFTRMLFKSRTGQEALRSFTVLPAISEKDFVYNFEKPENDRIEIVFQPKLYQDGCGCDEDTAPFSSCDPDGSVSRTMSALEHWNHRVVAPGYGQNYAFDDGSCDPCDESSAVWLGHPYANELVERLGRRFSDSGVHYEWLNQYMELQDMHESGKIVLVASCDPD